MARKSSARRSTSEGIARALDSVKTKTTSGSAVRVSGTTNSNKANYTAALKEFNKTNKPSKPKQPKGPGGWKGVLQDVMESPVGKGLMLLDTPRAYLTSQVADTAQEIMQGDLKGTLGSLVRPDWVNKQNRTAFWAHTGAGTYLQQGIDAAGLDDTWVNNRALKIALGLAGDIALDPLTWVGGGIAGSSANAGKTILGNAERLAIAAGDDAVRAAGSHLDDAVLAGIRETAETTSRKGTEALASKVIRKGKSAMSRDESLTHFPQASTFSHENATGLRLKIPGTGRGGKLLGYKGGQKSIPLLSKNLTNPITRTGGILKQALPNSELARKVSSAIGGKVPGVRELIRSGDPELMKQGFGMQTANHLGNAFEAAGIRMPKDSTIEGAVNAVGTSYAKGKQADMVFRDLSRRLKMKGNDWNAARDAVEGAVDAAQLASVKGAPELKQFLGDLYRVLKDELGANVDELDNYFPRIVTDEARAAYGLPVGRGGGAGRPTFTYGRTVINPEGVSNFTMRQFLDDIAKQDGLRSGFYENDAVRTIHSYIRGLSRVGGQKRALQHLLENNIVLNGDQMWAVTSSIKKLNPIAKRIDKRAAEWAAEGVDAVADVRKAHAQVQAAIDHLMAAENLSYDDALNRVLMDLEDLANSAPPPMAGGPDPMRPPPQGGGPTDPTTPPRPTQPTGPVPDPVPSAPVDPTGPRPTNPTRPPTSPVPPPVDPSGPIPASMVPDLTPAPLSDPVIQGITPLGGGGMAYAADSVEEMFASITGGLRHVRPPESTWTPDMRTYYNLIDDIHTEADALVAAGKTALEVKRAMTPRFAAILRATPEFDDSALAIMRGETAPVNGVLASPPSVPYVGQTREEALAQGRSEGLALAAKRREDLKHGVAYTHTGERLRDSYQNRGAIRAFVAQEFGMQEANKIVDDLFVYNAGAEAQQIFNLSTNKSMRFGKSLQGRWTDTLKARIERIMERVRLQGEHAGASSDYLDRYIPVNNFVSDEFSKGWINKATRDARIKDYPISLRDKAKWILKGDTSGSKHAISAETVEKLNQLHYDFYGNGPTLRNAAETVTNKIETDVADILAQQTKNVQAEDSITVADDIIGDRPQPEGHYLIEGADGTDPVDIHDPDIMDEAFQYIDSRQEQELRKMMVDVTEWYNMEPAERDALNRKIVRRYNDMLMEMDAADAANATSEASVVPTPKVTVAPGTKVQTLAIEDFGDNNLDIQDLLDRIGSDNVIDVRPTSRVVTSHSGVESTINGYKIDFNAGQIRNTEVHGMASNRGWIGSIEDSPLASAPKVTPSQGVARLVVEPSGNKNLYKLVQYADGATEGTIVQDNLTLDKALAQADSGLNRPTTVSTGKKFPGAKKDTWELKETAPGKFVAGKNDEFRVVKSKEVWDGTEPPFDKDNPNAKHSMVGRAKGDPKYTLLKKTRKGFTGKTITYDGAEWSHVTTGLTFDEAQQAVKDVVSLRAKRAWEAANPPATRAVASSPGYVRGDAQGIDNLARETTTVMPGDRVGTVERRMEGGGGGGGNVSGEGGGAVGGGSGPDPSVVAAQRAELEANLATLEERQKATMEMWLADQSSKEAGAASMKAADEVAAAQQELASFNAKFKVDPAPVPDAVAPSAVPETTWRLRRSTGGDGKALWTTDDGQWSVRLGPSQWDNPEFNVYHTSSGRNVVNSFDNLHDAEASIKASAEFAHANPLPDAPVAPSAIPSFDNIESSAPTPPVSSAVVGEPWKVGEAVKDIGGKRTAWITSDEQFVIIKTRGKARFRVYKIKPGSEGQPIFARLDNSIGASGASSPKFKDLEWWIETQYKKGLVTDPSVPTPPVSSVVTASEPIAAGAGGGTPPPSGGGGAGGGTGTPPPPPPGGTTPPPPPRGGGLGKPAPGAEWQGQAIPTAKYPRPADAAQTKAMVKDIVNITKDHAAATIMAQDIASVTAVQASSSAASIRRVLTSEPPALLQALQDEVARIRQVIKSTPKGMAKPTSQIEEIIQGGIDALVSREKLIALARKQSDKAIQASMIHEAEARLAEVYLEIAKIGKTQRAVRQVTNEANAKLTPEIEEFAQRVNSGAWQELSSNPGFYGPRDVADMWKQMYTVTTPQGMKGFFSYYDKYITWLKKWQIATPGFHIRNYLGGVFNNYLAGVDIGAVGKFYRTHRAWERGLLGEAEGKRFSELMDFLGGGGQYSPDEIGGGVGHSWKPWATNFVPIELSAAGGHKVEFYLRGALGWDRILKGNTVEMAIDDIAKFHFDYSDLSQMERKIKRVVPFYTWTRYNVPLQLEMLLENPGKYTKYQIIKDNIEQHSEEKGIVPAFLKQDMFGVRLPFNFGGGQAYATPDLPFTQTISNALPDFKNFDPGKSKSYSSLANNWLSMMSPAIKTPIELLKGEQFFKGIPMPKDYRGQTMPLGMNNPAGRAAGEFFGGNNKAAYLLEQLVPAYGRGRRLFPSEEKYKNRRPAAIASFFGAPIRGVTKDDQRNEYLRRYFAGLNLKTGEKRR